jgi:hypothetical protein
LSRELVIRLPSAELVDDISYGFRHALVQEAAYALLTDEDRTLGHRLAGAWLERVGTADAFVIADHYEAGACFDRAAAWFARSAEQAVAVHDMESAIERAERALLCGASGDTRLALRMLQAEASNWRVAPADGERYAREVVDAVPSGSERWFRAADLLLDALLRLDGDRAAAWFEEVRQVPPQPDALPALLRFLGRAALMGVRLGHLEIARPVLDQFASMPLDPRELEPQAAAFFLAVRATQAELEGRLDEAVRIHEHEIATLIGQGAVREATMVRLGLSQTLALLGDIDGAESTMEAARRDAVRMRLPLAAGVAQYGLALVRLAQGDAALASASAQVAFDAFANADATFAAASLGALSEASLALRNAEAAERHARAALGFRGLGAPILATLHAHLARAFAMQGRPAEAMREADEASRHAAIAGENDACDAHARLARMQALESAGDTIGAREAARTAADCLNARRAKLVDPRYRATFLSNVPVHAQTLDLVRAWGADCA